MAGRQDSLDEILLDVYRQQYGEGMQMDWQGQKGDAVLQVTAARSVPDDPEKAYAVSLMQGIHDKLDELEKLVCEHQKQGMADFITADCITTLIDIETRISGYISTFGFMRDSQNNNAQLEEPEQEDFDDYA